ncbi:orotate phosphoribosyltransferase [Brevibacillus sp. 7WMA2]|uniref:orotate phosphoribosyltransferase n=1 Tax=Brevibacillus TaxID=55080 RepID=UPI0003B1C647|nr:MULTISPECIES: orotate phosphoribosyltransferase [Brevibacillus]AYK04970.1 orotate phosphoribosyltransferase [Brevibacillus laterosporus]ERM19355.1 orotate phosphoribosyltransferase [Brevibacillus laterosporus PE36]MBA4533661.1 orotate phosphoribosyltransferase [Brevibacillus halotolerans]MDF9410744.1 orotate phosphoribosyltransferase [Brevibacillus laterosporus]PCN45663.1 orotate phosphoribosyltransferase [Brevibacillus laterosporus]
MNTTIAKQVAQHLLQIGAVHLRPDEPFIWTSGIASPIYCDNRITMTYPEVRSFLADAFVQIIRERFPEVEVIAGTATAGIPHAAWIADRLGLPMIYVRDKAKGHGRQNQIEGRIAAGQKVVVIEDLISTGGSSIKAARAVELEGAEILGVVAIFSYQFNDAERAFAEANYPLYTLSNYTALLEQAKDNGTINAQQEKVLSQWKEKPHTFYQEQALKQE